MRFRSTLTPILLSATFAAAQPSVTEPTAPPPPPPAAPEPAPLPPPPVVTTPPPPPPVTVSGPPGAMPPIVITITNNNNGNNSNTNTNTNTAPVTVTTPVTVSTPVTTTVTTTAAPTFAPPGDAPRVQLARDDLAVHHHGARRWLAVGATTDVHHPGQLGARASVDLLQHGHFSLGIAATVAAGESGKGHGEKHGSTDGDAIAYLAWSTSIHGFDVRASLGIGAGLGGGAEKRHDSEGGENKVSRMVVTAPGMHGKGGDGRRADLAPRAEAALLFGLPLGHHLGIAAGPVITTSALDHGHGRGDAVDVTLFAGLTYRL